jgi:hypothetical protein
MKGNANAKRLMVGQICADEEISVLKNAGLGCHKTARKGQFCIKSHQHGAFLHIRRSKY